MKFNPAESETYKALQEQQLGDHVQEVIVPPQTKVFTPNKTIPAKVNFDFFLEILKSEFYLVLFFRSNLILNKTMFTIRWANPTIPYIKVTPSKD